MCPGWEECHEIHYLNTNALDPWSVIKYSNKSYVLRCQPLNHFSPIWISYNIKTVEGLFTKCRVDRNTFLKSTKKQSRKITCVFIYDVNYSKHIMSNMIKEITTASGKIINKN